ncbi:hypothetical protein A11A3_13800 [Alcanivorax hongdengensis A-11-3]|uniref:Lipoprotein n=1 Tax=Alcanivorax hongdengensis A-11-3 TaxID=1177179 RepID=L0W929_9GAMM|nr:hypothetical protein [Alcanivorax hongdengensis]EKF73431.1 hypothetical protein A11A3_13800 [Alcanivorax hongdengensis A-11-3]
MKPVVALLALGLPLMLAACSNHHPVSPALPDNASSCPDRDQDDNQNQQVCTQEYRPVMGYDENGGILGDFPNACTACTDDRVEYTVPSKLPMKNLRPDTEAPARPAPATSVD